MKFDNNPKIDAINEFVSQKNRKITKIDLAALSINGRCLQEPMSDYLNRKDISSTDIKECTYSPKDFYESYNKTQESPKTESMELGTFSHSAILEPSLFRKFQVKRNYDLRTNEGLADNIRFMNRLQAYTFDLTGIETWKRPKLREYNDMLEDLSKGLIIEENYKEKILKIEVSLNSYRDGLISKILKGALTEVTMICIDPVTGLPVKIRPDFINTAENVGRDIIGSVKTTSAKTFSDFLSDCIKYQYEISEAMYQDMASHITGRNFDTTVMIVVQTVEPYHVYIVVWDDATVDYGRYRYEYNLAVIKDCMDKNVFPGIEAKAPSGNNGIYQLSYPDSVLARQEEPIMIE